MKSKNLQMMPTDEQVILLIYLLEQIVSDSTAVVDIPHVDNPETAYCHYCLKTFPLGEKDEIGMVHPVPKHERSCPYMLGRKLLKKIYSRNPDEN